MVTTPYYPWIFLFNIASMFFTFVGIPMLFPALEYLRTDVADERKLVTVSKKTKDKEFIAKIEELFELKKKECDEKT